MDTGRKVTATEFGLSRTDQVRIILSCILSNSGVAKMPVIYRAVEEHLCGSLLSNQGRASLREVVNRYAVREGYVYQHDPKNPGWRITPKGKGLVESEVPSDANTVLDKLRTQNRPSELSIDVEVQDLADNEIDEVIISNRLQIGIVETNTEIRLTRQRRGQQRLRELTLLNYSFTCAVCDVNNPALLVASHIVPWAVLPEIRGRLSNILCLCNFHDVLFEHGYWSLADDLNLLKRGQQASRTIEFLIGNAEGFRRPHNHSPEPQFLLWHRLQSSLPLP